jgi:hypothetical protein
MSCEDAGRVTLWSPDRAVRATDGPPHHERRHRFNWLPGSRKARAEPQPSDVTRVLRRVGQTQAGRSAVLSLLATQDICRIWQGTAHGTAERDRRAHHDATAELQRRGVLDPAGRFSLPD